MTILIFDTYECTFPIKWKYCSVCMCIHRINWICKLIKNPVAVCRKECGIQPLIFPHCPLPLSQGLDECPTPPHLSSSSGSPNGDQQINQPHAHDFCFSCALEQEYFWHFSCFYLFLNFLQLTDCFLLLVFPFFVTHYIV